MLSLLFNEPALFLRLSLFRIPMLLLTLCCHEWAHAFVANRCGDPTARLLGRMTLNPRKHLDPIGTLLMLFVGFGWAKPVPVNPRNFRNRLADEVKVSLAGVVTNLLLFLLLTAMAVSLNNLLWAPDVIRDNGGPLAFLGYNGYNFGLFTGENINGDLMQRTWLAPIMTFIAMGAQMNLAVAIFNLLPIPPLDGYHVANDLLLRGRFSVSPQVARMGMTAVMLLSFTTDIIGNAITFLASNAQEAVLRLFLMMTGN